MEKKLAWVRKRVKEGVSYRIRTVAGGHWAANCLAITPQKWRQFSQFLP
jgi:hypothetical protein